LVNSALLFVSTVDFLLNFLIVRLRLLDKVLSFRFLIFAILFFPFFGLPTLPFQLFVNLLVLLIRSLLGIFGIPYFVVIEQFEFEVCFSVASFLPLFVDCADQFP
jgi:hypothetical protein